MRMASGKIVLVTGGSQGIGPCRNSTGRDLYRHPAGQVGGHIRRSYRQVLLHPVADRPAL